MPFRNARTNLDVAESQTTALMHTKETTILAEGDLALATWRGQHT